MFSPLEPEDQQLGGILMMFLQQIIYGLSLLGFFLVGFLKKILGVDPMPDSLPYSK